MSSTTRRDRADQMNLSPSRTSDGVSANTATIPAVNPAADCRGDSVDDFSDPPPVAPPARTSRRGFLMNTMVSAASLVTATAVTIPTIDPTFGLIAAKRTADVAHLAAINLANEAEARYGVGSHHPHALEAQKNSDAACQRVIDADWRLARTPPTTLAGIAAVLRFANEIEETGCEWPNAGSIGPEEWGYQLRSSMVQAIEAITRQGAVTAAMGPIPVAVTADPIFAAIEAHNKAAELHSKCVRHQYDLEEALPFDKCESGSGPEIVETDDPQFIEAVHATNDACDKMFELAVALIDTPTTAAGVVTLLKYVSDNHGGDNDWMFPEYVSDNSDKDDEDELGEPYQLAVMRHAGVALDRMTTSTAA